MSPTALLVNRSWRKINRVLSQSRIIFLGDKGPIRVMRKKSKKCRMQANLLEQVHTCPSKTIIFIDNLNIEELMEI